MKADKKQGVGTLTYCLTVALDYYAIKNKQVYTL